jgi:hypothetical protein
MSRIKLMLFFFVVLDLGSGQAFASITYAAGSCKPKLPSFVTIQGALNATPSPNVVFVCPGTYNEQVTITQPVILQGVASANSEQAIIAPPSGGLTANATDDFGHPLAVQLWVENTPGPVNISNIVFDATGNGVLGCPPYIVGVFYQNSAGTISSVATRNQQGNNCGVGIWAEGGSANPSVTIQNNTIHEVDERGINSETNSSSPELTVTVRGNVLNVANLSSSVGIAIDQATSATVTGNFVVAGSGTGLLSVQWGFVAKRCPPS